MQRLLMAAVALTLLGMTSDERILVGYEFTCPRGVESCNKTADVQFRIRHLSNTEAIAFFEHFE